MSDPISERPGPATNGEIASILGSIADLMEFGDENPFKVRSFRIASLTIAEMEGSVADIAARSGAAGLQELDGVGKAISMQIMEIIEHGSSTYFESLKAKTPLTALDLLKVSGIGLKNARLLYGDFGIKTLQELKDFAEGGGLASVPGFGDKTIKRVMNSLARIEKAGPAERLAPATTL
jgi:DNA polymerase (family 10)